MLAVATNLNYICNNDIIVDSDYSKNYKMTVEKRHIEQVDADRYPCDTNPIAIVLESSYSKVTVSCTKNEANELIRLLTKVL